MPSEDIQPPLKSEVWIIAKKALTRQMNKERNSGLV